MSRELSPDAANTLKAGDDHYRAYVGPPKRFGLLTQLQMSLLSALALEETDRVLDFGCGSLRLGRSLIPFLHKGGYCGIDPNGWLIEEGLDRECGRDICSVKAPRFATNADFDCTVFDETFDFIMAQSIITHSGPDQTERLFETAAQALKTDGILLLSYIKAKPRAALPDPGWSYPANIAYPEDWLIETARRHGLVWRELDWFHPGAVWAGLARDERRFPASGFPLGRRGAPAPRWRSDQTG
jgi:SAM-dependent methyltransferase